MVLLISHMKYLQQFTILVLLVAILMTSCSDDSPDGPVLPGYLNQVVGLDIIPRHMQRDKEGNIYVAGWTGETVNRIAKINEDLQLVWVYNFTGNRRNIDDMILASDNTLVGTGWHEPGTGPALNAWVFKINLNGEVLWEFVHNINNLDRGNSIVESTGQQFVVCGQTFHQENLVEVSDPVVFIVSNTGALVDQKVYTSSINEEALSITNFGNDPVAWAVGVGRQLNDSTVSNSYQVWTLRETLSMDSIIDLDGVSNNDIGHNVDVFTDKNSELLSMRDVAANLGEGLRFHLQKNSVDLDSIWDVELEDKGRVSEQLVSNENDCVVLGVMTVGRVPGDPRMQVRMINSDGVTNWNWIDDGDYPTSASTGVEVATGVFLVGAGINISGSAYEGVYFYIDDEGNLIE